MARSRGGELAGPTKLRIFGERNQGRTLEMSVELAHEPTTLALGRERERALDPSYGLVTEVTAISIHCG